MQISKKKLKKDVKKRAYKTFFQTLADLKDENEINIFLSDFLTQIELIALVKRLMVALSLEDGKSYDFIKKNYRVSSATIANIDKMMHKNSQGFILAFKKIKAEQWAEKSAKKITGFFSNLTGKNN